MVITARTGLFAWLLAVTLAAAVPVTCAVMRAHPAPPEPCVSSASLQTRNSTAYECPPGARLSIMPVSPETTLSYAVMLIRCDCESAAVDASAGGD